MPRITLYADEQSSTLNLVCKLTPLTKVGNMISPIAYCAAPLNPTRTVDFLIIPLWSRPIPSKRFWITCRLTFHHRSIHVASSNWRRLGKWSICHDAHRCIRHRLQKWWTSLLTYSRHLTWNLWELWTRENPLFLAFWLLDMLVCKCRIHHKLH